MIKSDGALLGVAALLLQLQLIVNQNVPSKSRLTWHMHRAKLVLTKPDHRTAGTGSTPRWALAGSKTAVAEMASVGVMTVSRVRNGDPDVMYITFKKVVEAIGLTVAEVSTLKRAR